MMRIAKDIIIALSVTISSSRLFAEPAISSCFIDQYLSGKSSPIAGNGTVFAAEGLKYVVDPRLVVAIAGAESSFGTNWVNCPQSGFNAWSWFYNANCANSPFASFAAATVFQEKSSFNELSADTSECTFP
jgi:hypothetical protein